MSLQVWLPLTGDTRNQGLSGVTPTNNGATVDDNGKLGKCYSFNGSSTITTNYICPSTSNWSVACWVKPSFNSGTICRSADNKGPVIDFYTSGSSLKIRGFVWYSSSSYYMIDYTLPSYSDWIHIVLTQGSGKLTLYINGIFIQSVAADNSLYTTDGLVLGYGSGYGYLNGQLNDFRFYNNTLSESEIKELARGLMLHYPLNRQGLGPDNLLKNGFGELGSENWDSRTNISTSDIPSGQSDIKASFGNGYSIEHIKLYTTHTYKFTTWIKATATSGNTYPSLFPYDIDGNFINHYNCPDGFNLATMTTLKQALKAGDTKIYVNDLSQWNANSGHYYNYAAIFSYTDGVGRTYPDGAYTQNMCRFGNSTNAKTNLDKTNNIITLTSAYTGPTMSIGTKLCASTEGSTYFYPWGGINLANIQDWTYKEATVSGNANRLRYANYVTFFTYSNNRMAGIKIVDLTNEGMNSTTEYDISGFQNNGTKNNITYTSDTPKYDVSSIFNGTDSYIKVDGNSWMPQGATQMTINLWAKATTWPTNGGRLVSCTETGGFNLEAGNSGYWRFPIYVYTNSGQTSSAYKYDSNEIKISELTSNEWNMITLVYDTTGTKTYINGVLHHTYTNTSYGIHFNTNARLFLGCEANTASPSTPYFSGQESDFRIYATALSTQDIAQLYSENKLT